MAGRKFTIVYGKLSKPINDQNYYSAFLEEGTTDKIDQKTFATHSLIGDASDYAGIRHLSCINSGDEATVLEIPGNVE